MSENNDESWKVRQMEIIEADSVFYRNPNKFRNQILNTRNSDMEVLVIFFHADWLSLSKEVAEKIDTFIQKGNARHMDASGLRKIRLMKVSVKNMKITTLNYRVGSYPALLVVNKNLRIVGRFTLEMYEEQKLLFKAVSQKLDNML